MKPLNYAILKYFTTVKEASPVDVYEAIKGEYGSYRMCTVGKIDAAIMTAEKNGLLKNLAMSLITTANWSSIIML